jgi:hypothetical protein
MRLPHFPALLFLSLATMAGAHPTPEVPVRASLEEDGSFTLQVEIDPRCFEPDPEQETYLTKVQLEKLMSPQEQDAMKAQSAEFAARAVEYFFEPSGPFKPEFTWSFTTLGGGPLEKFDDTVVATGSWRSKLPEGTQGYSIRAKDPRDFNVVFENTLRGKRVERTAVLFPGEKSFTLDMSGKNASSASAPAAITEETLQTNPQEAPQASKTQSGSSWFRIIAVVVAAGAALWLARLGRA